MAVGRAYNQDRPEVPLDPSKWRIFSVAPSSTIAGSPRVWLATVTDEAQLEFAGRKLPAPVLLSDDGRHWIEVPATTQYGNMPAFEVARAAPRNKFGEIVNVFDAGQVAYLDLAASATIAQRAGTGNLVLQRDDSNLPSNPVISPAPYVPHVVAVFNVRDTGEQIVLVSSRYPSSISGERVEDNDLYLTGDGRSLRRVEESERAEVQRKELDVVPDGAGYSVEISSECEATLFPPGETLQRPTGMPPAGR